MIGSAVVNNKIVLIGAGGHAKVCIDVIEQCAQYQIVGLVGIAGEVGKEVLGYRVVEDEVGLLDLRNQLECAFVTVGQLRSPDSRMRIFELLRSLKFTIPAFISLRASVSSHVVIGDGTLVMPQAVLNAGASVGKNCIVNTGAIIEHDAVVGDHCHISTGVTVNGGVQIGLGSFIGSGSVIKEGVKIGQRVVVGMGIKVRKDLADGVMYVG